MTSKHVKNRDQRPPPAGRAEAPGGLQRVIAAAGRHDLAGKAELVLCALACLALVGLHLVLYQHAGAFWRDECSSILLARAPGLGDMWSGLDTDSFPALFVGLLRTWIQAGPGATDAGIRLLGTLIALGTVASLWFSCRALGARVPLVALSLVCFNGTVFYFGSSIRAYGLAVLLVMPCLAAFWKVAAGPTRRNVAAAGVLAVLCAQCNYQNCYLLFGMGVAGAAVCAMCGQWRRAFLILGLGLVAAVSLLIYVPTIRHYRDTIQVSNFSLPFSVLGGKLAVSFAPRNVWLGLVWIGLLLAALIYPLAGHLRRERSAPAERRPSLPLYCLITLLVSIGCGLLFMKVNGMFPFVWHAIPLIALVGVSVEIAFQPSRQGAGATLLRLLIGAVVLALSVRPAWYVAHTRRTNLDLVCAVLAERAGPEDLVLVNPFYLAPGLNYHYQAAAPWITLPSMPDEAKRTGRHYAGIKALMASRNPMDATLQQIRGTLETGHRLWIVGGVMPNDNAPVLPPAPNSPFGWHNAPYVECWSAQAGNFLQGHVLRSRAVLEPSKESFDLENVHLILVEGWRPRPGLDESSRAGPPPGGGREGE